MMPVAYGVRPRQIHYVVTRKGYEPRITQRYFEGGDRNATDRYAKKELIIAVAPGSWAGSMSGRFDIALEREHPAETGAPKTHRDHAGVYEAAPAVKLTVHAQGRRLPGHVSAVENDGDATDGELMPRAKARFFVPEHDFEVTFVRNERGETDHALDSLGRLSKEIG